MRDYFHQCHQEHWWSSSRTAPCRAAYPGSIPGQCIRHAYSFLGSPAVQDLPLGQFLTEGGSPFFAPGSSNLLFCAFLWESTPSGPASRQVPDRGWLPCSLPRVLKTAVTSFLPHARTSTAGPCCTGIPFYIIQLRCYPYYTGSGRNTSKTHLSGCCDILCGHTSLNLHRLI